MELLFLAPSCHAWSTHSKALPKDVRRRQREKEADVLNFAAQLLRRDPAASPKLAVADEDHAFRNYANSDPALHIAMVTLPGKSGTEARFFADGALSLGDGAGVYAYNRFRLVITVFLLYEFFIPVWSYFDDSALVARASLSDIMWYIFLKIHALLKIPIKGNPLAGNSDAGNKFFPPNGYSFFLVKLGPS